MLTWVIERQGILELLDRMGQEVKSDLELKDIPVVILTASSEEEDIVKSKMLRGQIRIGPCGRSTREAQQTLLR